MKTILFNPFQKFSEKQLLVFSLVLTSIVSVLVTLLNGRFDGVFDLHFVEKTTFTVSVLDLGIDISILTIILFIAGKFINKKTRLIDILATSLVAKIPLYFLIFSNINNKMFLVTQKLMDSVAQNKFTNIESNTVLLLIFSGIASLACLIWTIILLYNGFKTATNLKETKHILYFILALIVAEALSKISILKLI